MNEQQIELGDVVKDKITGFTGVAVARHKWLHGCERYSVQPRELLEGKPIDTQVFDAPQLVIVEKAVTPETKHTGGPRVEPRRDREPRR